MKGLSQIMKREQFIAARDRATRMIRDAGITISQVEIENMDVADFGLSHLETEGAQMLTFFNTNRVSAKVLVLFPHQTEPEHWHTSVGNDPGKEETVRVVSGVVRFYIPGENNMKYGFIPDGKEAYYTVRQELILQPGDQITLQPGTKHWFQAGATGSVMFSFSSSAKDALDPFTDPNIIRITQIED
jgi:D-lyxose ketol-isomerase